MVEKGCNCDWLITYFFAVIGYWIHQVIFQNIKIIWILTLLINSLCAMDCSDYNDFQKFNGHYYSMSIDKLTFESAKQIPAAISRRRSERAIVD